MSVVKNDTLFVEIGSTCLKDFLNTNAIEKIIWTSNFVQSLEDVISSGRELGNKIQPVYSLAHILGIVIHIINENGYVSRAKANELEIPATSSETLFAYYGDRYNDIPPYYPSESELSEAHEVIEYVKTITVENDYKYNLFKIAEAEYTTQKTIGYAVSMIPFYRRAMEQKSPKFNKSEHVGVIGDRVKLSLKLINVAGFNTAYGFMSIYKFNDKDGNDVIWKTNTNQDFSVGDKVECLATIKSHDEYKGVNQTIINRPKFN